MSGIAGGFGAALQAARRAAGLTQQELANRAGVGERTVRELERGRAVRPQRSTVDLLADGLGLAGPARARFTAAARGRDEAAPQPVPQPGVVALPPSVPLIGREESVREVSTLVVVAEAVTVVGMAGVGKTCLALAVAHGVADRFPGGVAGVAVVDVDSQADLLAMVAGVFGVGRADELPERCAGRAAALLLDGADRAPEASVAAIGWLRARVPTLHVLVTSRHPLGLPGEVEFPVEPLEVPPPEAVDLAEVLTYPAAALFLDRLRRVRRHPVTGADAPVLAGLVRRLGGLPLALELAAARGRVLELGEILDRYGDRVLDLAGAGRDGQTVRDAVAASYRLLDPSTQHALRRLSAFAARWSVDLAEALLGGNPEAAIDRLVGLGLVSVRPAGELRFRLLDVVHDFALERAAEAGQLDAARARHAEVIAAVAVRTAPKLMGRGLQAAVASLDHLSSDLVAALEHASADDPPTALHLASALPRYWRFRGRDREGRDCLHRLLADPRTAPVEPAVRAWARLGVAMLAAEHGDGATELPAAEAALAAFVALGNVPGELAARDALCGLWQAVGGYDRAYAHGTAALALASGTGRLRDVGVAENNLAWHDIRTGDLAEATRRLNRAVRLGTDLDDARLRALAQANLAEVARLDGRYATAVATGRRALARLVDVGDPGHRLRVLGTIGLALVHAGRRAEAEAALADLPEGCPAVAGARTLLAGYLALDRGERGAAAKAFAGTVPALDGRRAVEALVGLVCAVDNPGERAAALARLAQVRRWGGLTLLPRERALLKAAGAPVED